MDSWIQAYVRNLGPGEFQLHALILLLALAFLLYRIVRNHRQFRLVDDTPTSRIASAAQGQVELKGLGEWMPGSQIHSPFSQQRCLWYQCTMEQRRQLNDDRAWIHVSTQTSDELFHLQDDSGVCVIDPTGAQVIPSVHREWYGRNANDRAYASRGKHRWAGWIPGGGRYRFNERLIGVADPIYALGFFETRYFTPDEANDTGAPQQVHHLLRKPSDSREPFILSAQPEGRLLQKNRWIITIQIALFFLLLYVLLIAFNVRTW